MKVTAQLKNFRIAPRKVRLLAEVLRGYDVDEALLNLKHTIKRSTDPLTQLLGSAIANAENNFGLDRRNLYVSDFQVGEATRLKRWMPRAFGRATPIIKRSSHITIVVDERIEGKNRKSKEQLDKERKDREETRKKMEKEIMDERKESQDVKPADQNRIQTKKEAVDKEGRKAQKGGWASKMFNRKSM